MKTNLLSLLLCMAFSVCAFSQNVKPYNIISVEPSGSNYLITYSHNPTGDEANTEYEVSIRLLRESDKEFSVPLTNASGDIGSGKFTGSTLKVTWDYRKQFPKGLPYDDIVFELNVQKKAGGSSNWIYYVGGAAVVGGGAAILLMKKSTTTSPPPPSSLPEPPSGRPY